MNTNMNSHSNINTDSNSNTDGADTIMTNRGETAMRNIAETHSHQPIPNLLSSILGPAGGPIFTGIIGLLNRTERQRLRLAGVGRVLVGFRTMISEFGERGRDHCEALRPQRYDVHLDPTGAATPSLCGVQPATLHPRLTQHRLRPCVGPSKYGVDAVHHDTMLMCGNCVSEARERLDTRGLIIPVVLCRRHNEAELARHPPHTHVCECAGPSSEVMTDPLCYDCREDEYLETRNALIDLCAVQLRPHRDAHQFYDAEDIRTYLYDRDYDEGPYAADNHPPADPHDLSEFTNDVQPWAMPLGRAVTCFRCRKEEDRLESVGQAPARHQTALDLWRSYLPHPHAVPGEANYVNIADSTLQARQMGTMVVLCLWCQREIPRPRLRSLRF